MLYAGCGEELARKKESEGEKVFEKEWYSERDDIIAFYELYDEYFDKYNPFIAKEIEPFRTRAIHNYRDHNDEWPERNRLGVIRGDRKALLKVLYQVRCNFVHGNKRFGSPDDRDVVACAATILRNMLATLPFVIKTPPVSE